MSTYTDIFKIETNHVVPVRGKVLISEPFLCDKMFGRSVVLLIDHTSEGTMGLVLNKPFPLSLSDIFHDIAGGRNIPIYWGGPLGADTIFYLHTIEGIPGAFLVGKGLYVNGDFNAVRDYINRTPSVEGTVRFFMGYSGWESGQLEQEIEENTWIVGRETTASLMDEKASVGLWQKSLSKLGGKYAVWSRFPQIPTLN